MAMVPKIDAGLNTARVITRMRYENIRLRMALHHLRHMTRAGGSFYIDGARIIKEALGEGAPKANAGLKNHQEAGA